MLADGDVNAATIEDAAGDLQLILDHVLPSAKNTLAFSNPDKTSGYRYRSKCIDRRLRGLGMLRRILYISVKRHRDMCTGSRGTRAGDALYDRMRHFLDKQVQEVPVQHHEQFPNAAQDTLEEEWQAWEKECLKSRRDAQKLKDKMTKQLKQEAVDRRNTHKAKADE